LSNKDFIYSIDPFAPMTKSQIKAVEDGLKPGNSEIPVVSVSITGHSNRICDNVRSFITRRK
jgi:hypothetical protein